MKTLLSLFNHATKQFANYPFLSMSLRWRTLQWTYQEFKETTYNIARLLEQHQIGKGDNVIIISPNSPYWVASFFATLLRGGVAVPLNPKSTDELIEKVLEQTKTKLVLKSAFINSKTLNHIPHIDIDTYRWKSVEQIDLSPVHIDENDIAEIVYTSGTTGDPKGVILSHKNIMSNVEILTCHLRLPNYTKLVSILPLFHMYEQVGGLFRPMMTGCSIMYSPGVSSKAIRMSLQKQKASVMLVVPEVLEALIRRIKGRLQKTNRLAFFEFMLKISRLLPMFLQRMLFWRIHNNLGGNLKLIACGGAPLPSDLEATWNALGVRIYQGYGLTETSPLVSFNYPGCSRAESVGKVINPIKVKIADDGEILVKGPNVFQGYYKNKKKTEESFTEDGWYKTGDVGSLDKDNFLFIGSRKKYMIVSSSGENIYPEDIEEQLKKQPGVRDATVLGVKNGNHEIVYAVLLGEISNPEAVIEKANQLLSPYQRIQDWALWPYDDFPRSAIRKVKKNEVLEWVTKQENQEKKEVRKTPQQTSPLLKVVASVAGKDSHDVSANSYLYRDLHFDSLKRIELVARIEDEFDATINENDITQKTQVKDLEGLMEKSDKSVQEGSIKPLLFTRFAEIIRTTFQNIILFPLYRTRISYQVQGLKQLENLELPAVFMMNHLSYIDTVIALYALPKTIRKKIALGAAVDVFYQYKLLAPIAEFLFNAFPLPRKEYENIKPGLERIGKILDKGYSVLIFPEGKISLDGALQPLKQGAGLIASEMNAPIVPIIASGLRNIIPKYTLFPRRRGVVTVKFGKPLYIEPGTSYEKATEKIHHALEQLAQ